IASHERAHIVETTQGGSWTEEDLANARYISTFDPPTVLSLLGEIERLRRWREARVPVYLTPKQTEFLIEQAERQRWFWHRKAKAATDGRIYNYWNAEETWARIR